jgi:hypothetical protein
MIETFAGKYRIVDQLGSGRMATVSCVVDETAGRDVAVHLLRNKPINRARADRCQTAGGFRGALKKKAVAVLETRTGRPIDRVIERD